MYKAGSSNWEVSTFNDGQWEGEPIKSESVSRATHMWEDSVSYSRGGTCV